MKQNYAYHSIQDLNQAAEKKNATNEIIIVPSLEDSNQLSSITKKTNDSLYNVELSWNSVDLKEGRDTIFMMKFLNYKTNLEVKQIDYSLKVIILSSANLTIKDVKNQKAPIGTGIQIVKFPIPGPINISINISNSQLYPRTENEKTNNNYFSSNSSEEVNFTILIPPREVPNEQPFLNSQT